MAVDGGNLYVDVDYFFAHDGFHSLDCDLREGLMAGLMWYWWHDELGGPDGDYRIELRHAGLRVSSVDAQVKSGRIVTSSVMIGCQ